MNNMQTPSEQLRAWRAYCRLTPAQVSQYTGVPEATLVAIEEGSVFPDAPMAERLNGFFARFQAQYDQNLQMQQARQSQSYPGPGSPGYGLPVMITPVAPPARSYPGPAYHPPAQSYPGPAPVYMPPAQSYPGQASFYAPPPAQSYPGQNVIYYAPVQEAAVYAEEKPRYKKRSAVSVVGAIMLSLMYLIAFIFIFFPFMNLMVGDVSGGVVVGGTVRVMSGISLFVYPYYSFSLAALGAQIGLWVTVIAGIIMVLFAVIRNLGANFVVVRTIAFYIYLIGVIALIVGLVAAIVGGVYRWAYIVYTVLTVCTLVCRIITDGGARSFVIVRD